MYHRTHDLYEEFLLDSNPNLDCENCKVFGDICEWMEELVHQLYYQQDAEKAENAIEELAHYCKVKIPFPQSPTKTIEQIMISAEEEGSYLEKEIC